MLKVHEFTEALRKMLKEAPTLTDVKSVERGDYWNTDPARTPWIGIYKTAADYEPKVLGSHSKSWKGTLTVRVILQVYGENGQKAEDELENLIQRVTTVMFGDLTVRQYVSMLNSLKIVYSFEEDESESMRYQWAFLTAVFETRTGP